MYNLGVEFSELEFLLLSPFHIGLYQFMVKVPMKIHQPSASHWQLSHRPQVRFKTRMLCRNRFESCKLSSDYYFPLKYYTKETFVRKHSGLSWQVMLEA